MNETEILSFLEKVKNETLDISESVKIIKNLPYENLDFAKIDTHRGIRKGFPEVVFCSGKTPEQIKLIAGKMVEHNITFLGTRVSPDALKFLLEVFPGAEVNNAARTILIRGRDITRSSGAGIAVVSAGTSDIPVAEEACVTADAMGQNVKKVYDVGVAGIHRLFDHLKELNEVNAVVIVAGMEGALASVVGGLISTPIIAVPTSIGYGANFSGIAPLLTMLNSCAPGISVVNIDNGFGAGYMAAIIARQVDKKIV